MIFMKKLSKDTALNFAVGGSIPLTAAVTTNAGGCTGICGSCGGACLGGVALAVYLGSRIICKRSRKSFLKAETPAVK